MPLSVSGNLRTTRVVEPAFLAASVLPATSLVLWSFVLWGSWQCLGLLDDGAWFFTSVVERGWFVDYDEKSREYVIALTQVPLVIGLRAGVTDLHWLARLFSFGTLALPAALYQLALLRAKDDPLLLAAAIAAIASVHSTSFMFSVGEYNTAYAIAIAAVCCAVSPGAPRLLDGIVLAALAVIAVRSYEVFSYLGPLLGALMLWRSSRAPSRYRGGAVHGALAAILLMILPVAVSGLALLGRAPLPVVAGAVFVAAGLSSWLRPRDRPRLAVVLHLAAAAGFMAASVVAMASIGRVGGAPFAGAVAVEGLGFWQNPQFDLMLAALAVFAAFAVLRPAALATPTPWLLSVIPLVPLALLPIFQWREWPVRPLSTLHFEVRTVCGPIVAAFIYFVWARASGIGANLRLFEALGTPAVAARCLVFSSAMLLSILPSNLVATAEWTSLVETVRDAGRNQRGIITAERWPRVVKRFYWDEIESPFLPSLSLALRNGPDDAVFTPFPGGTAVPALDLGRYRWRD